MIILGIESSCDETAAALVTDKRIVLASGLSSQIEQHQEFGGVVPEVAARAHLQLLEPMVRDILRQASITLHDIDAIAATAGPGLIGGLIVGVTLAKGMAMGASKPFIAINHLEAHALTVRFCEEVEFPFLLLLVSGGHCQLLIVHDVGSYQPLGTTLDDAVGEAFDKVARLLNLGYPGGPFVEKRALKGDPARFSFPRPLLHKPGYDFSFAGLKTAVRHQLSLMDKKDDQTIADICASFQEAVGDSLVHRVEYAMKNYPDVKTFVMAGGVACNAYLRNRLISLSHQYNIRCSIPPIELCTDNAIMVAWAGVERYKKGQVDRLDFAPRPRWPLTEL